MRPFGPGIISHAGVAGSHGLFSAFGEAIGPRNHFAHAYMPFMTRVRPPPASTPPARGRRGIDSEFSAVCRAIWGYTLDDFTDDDLSPEDHHWLDGLTQECAFAFAVQQGYDLKDYIRGGFVSDWWGFTWMILAEARQVLTPEKRAAAWCRHGEKTWWA
jgi:hypothetical protein